MRERERRREEGEGEREVNHMVGRYFWDFFTII